MSLTGPWINSAINLSRELGDIVRKSFNGENDGLISTKRLLAYMALFSSSSSS